MKKLAKKKKKGIGKINNKRRKCRLCGCSENNNTMKEKPIDGKPIRVCKQCYNEIK
ncbi:MAG: hypothetical protein KKE23_03700 [Nanoarchaeota archaeon]|nr:hypothetical protein [Nanoarchaeota archaeon]